MSWVFRLLLILTLTIASACGDTTRNEQGGGGVVDGGGGDPLKSDAGDIESAVKKAVRLVSEPDFRMNILVRFLIEERQEIMAPYPEHRFAFFFPSLPPEAEDEEWTPALGVSHLKTIYELPPSAWESPVLQALRRHPISFNCQESEDRGKAASISSFNKDAHICFWVQRLTDQGPDGLFPQVLALVVHEAVHMAGGNEETAQNWQNAFNRFYYRNFNSFGMADENLTRMILAETTMLSSLDTLLRCVQKSNCTKEVRESLNVNRGVFDSIQLREDPLALYVLFPRREKEAVDYANTSVFIKQAYDDFLKKLDDGVKIDADEVYSLAALADTAQINLGVLMRELREPKAEFGDQEKLVCASADWSKEPFLRRKLVISDRDELVIPRVACKGFVPAPFDW